ncbi:hypothetical protein SAMN05421747_101107 [Parapedobacter composti]|uniref:Uncharacterized protein n=2 Tax=Parapedobacter composti TaxID=623281 RepID=A0A1I1DUB8_9SPHI|nr:hypothetical protein SAMN05421747_101107 [Parapedobacter composti]
MPMETIIPILIAITVFALQAYANYQKEQEKARKRNLGRPPLPEDNADHLPHGPDHRSRVPDPRSPTPGHRSPTPDPRPQVKPAFEDYSGVVDARKIRRIRQARDGRQTPQRLEVEEGTAPLAKWDEPVFDLRDAVIKSAILERPYK